MCILPRSAPALIRRRGMKRIIRKMAPALCFSALIGGGAHPLSCAVRSGGASPDCAHGDGLKFTSCAGFRSTCAHAR